MGFLVALAIFVLIISRPAAAAQGYQRYSDGLFSVGARKVVAQDRRIGFEVCAQMVKQEIGCPLEVRLNFWGPSGRFLSQTSSVLRIDSSAAVCQTILLPEEAQDMVRWEIARFRCQARGAINGKVDGHADANSTK